MKVYKKRWKILYKHIVLTAAKEVSWYFFNNIASFYLTFDLKKNILKRTTFRFTCAEILFDLAALKKSKLDINERKKQYFHSPSINGLYTFNHTYLYNIFESAFQLGNAVETWMLFCRKETSNNHKRKR